MECLVYGAAEDQAYHSLSMKVKKGVKFVAVEVI